jgi:hypothetical protein
VDPRVVAQRQGHEARYSPLGGISPLKKDVHGARNGPGATLLGRSLMLHPDL